MSTGTWNDRSITSAWNVASVTSTTQPPGAGVAVPRRARPLQSGPSRPRGRRLRTWRPPSRAQTRGRRRFAAVMWSSVPDAPWCPPLFSYGRALRRASARQHPSRTAKTGLPGRSESASRCQARASSGIDGHPGHAWCPFGIEAIQILRRFGAHRLEAIAHARGHQNLRSRHESHRGDRAGRRRIRPGVSVRAEGLAGHDGDELSSSPRHAGPGSSLPTLRHVDLSPRPGVDTGLLQAALPEEFPNGAALIADLFHGQHEQNRRWRSSTPQKSITLVVTPGILERLARRPRQTSGARSAPAPGTRPTAAGTRRRSRSSVASARRP